MIKAGFYLLSAVMIGSLVIMILRSKADSADKKKSTFILLTFIGIWLLYIGMVVWSSVTETRSMTPRVPLFIFLPLSLGLLTLIRTPVLSRVIQQTSTSWPVGIQCFRILVELLIYGGFIEGIFVRRVTFEGYNLDILVGILALPVMFILSKVRLRKWHLLTWNLFGLGILSVTVSAFIYSFYFAETHLINLANLVFPYVLLPVILLPVAILYHLISIKQALKMK